MTTEAERRQRIRIPTQNKIRHSQYQVLGTPVFQENSSIDLSSGGISFETERDYQIGNLVLLEVEVNGEALKLLVCVAWIKNVPRSSVKQVGAELIAIDPVHKRRMQRHLNGMIDLLEKSRKPKKKSNAVSKKSKAKKVKGKKAPIKKSTKKKIAKKKSKRG